MALACTGCIETKLQPPTAKQSLIGKSEAELAACAGQPKTVAPHGEANVFTYYREGGLLEESFPGSKSSRPEGLRHACMAIVTLEHNRVTQVKFLMTPASSASHEHCEEIFQRCGP